MADIIQTKSNQEFVTTFTDTVASEAEQTVNTSEGSVVLGFGKGAALNSTFLQAMVQQTGLDSRLDTAEDEALDTWVGQFSPPFDARLSAAKAYSAPVAPTVLAAPLAAGHVYVETVTDLLVGQQLRLTKGTKLATTTITAVEPTTALTGNVSQGVSVLPVASTSGMVTGGTLYLVDGSYAVETTIVAVNSPTDVTVTPINGLVAHTYLFATTIVTLKQVVVVGAVTYTTPAVEADFTVGTVVRAITMLQGQRFYRNKAAASSPFIQARTTLLAGYRVQDKVSGTAYEVVADTTNPDFDALTGQYRIPADGTEVYTKIEAVVAGTVSHVTARTLSVLPTALSGIDGTENTYAIANASDTESNEALRARFKLFLQGLGNTGSRASIEAAIAGVQAGIQYTLLENVDVDGITAKPGHFVALVSDLFGNLPQTLYALVVAAVDRVRPITVRWALKAPVLNQPVIVITVAVDTLLFDAVAVRAAVQLAVYSSFTNTGSGARLVSTQVLRLAQQTLGVTEVVGLTVNGNGFSNINGTYVTIGTGIENVTAAPLEFLRPSLANITVN